MPKSRPKVVINLEQQHKYQHTVHLVETIKHSTTRRRRRAQTIGKTRNGQQTHRRAQIHSRQATEAEAAEASAATVATETVERIVRHREQREVTVAAMSETQLVTLVAVETTTTIRRSSSAAAAIESTKSITSR